MSYRLCIDELILSRKIRLRGGGIGSQQNGFTLAARARTIRSKCFQPNGALVSIIPSDLHLARTGKPYLRCDHHISPNEKRTTGVIVLPKTPRGPYRDRTGDLHNAIVALSHAELTAQELQNIRLYRAKVNFPKRGCGIGEFSVSF